jgi:shikimate dehydrogenase
MSEETNSQIFGILGESLSHTLSPQIHNHFFERFGLGFRYHPFPIKAERLKQALEGIRALGIRGMNVTFPFKEKVIPYLDELDGLAEKLGAVNTIVNDDSKLIGYNTDALGIRMTIEEKLELNLKGKVVFLLGAGGAAKACFYELLRQKPNTIVVFNRSLVNAQKMLDGFADRPKETEVELKPLDQIGNPHSGQRVALLMNATSADCSLIEGIVRRLSTSCTFAGARVFDLNYNQRALCGRISTPGIQYMDGLYMLASQAAESFRIWTKIRLNPDEVFAFITRKVKEK